MNKNSILDNWIFLSSTDIGKRNANEDRLNSFFLLSAENNFIVCLIACDGVGGISGGSLCAELLCNEISSKINQLVKIEGRKLFYFRNLKKLKNTISCLRLEKNTEGASTLVVLLANLSRFRDGFRFITIWAGDSRSHIIDNDLVYCRLTEDHHDSDYNITAYYDLLADNFLGEVSYRSYSFKNIPVIFGVTTDGVHDKCTENELQLFLIYCLYKNVNSDAMFSEYFRIFLGENISDNFSASFIFTKYFKNTNQLKDILETKK